MLDLDGVVFYDGAHTIAGSFKSRNLVVASLDPVINSSLDFATGTGFLTAVSLAARTKPRGFAWIWFPGDTWTCNKRKVSGRTVDNPTGFDDNVSVNRDNLVFYRLMLLATILTARGCMVMMLSHGSTIVHRMSQPYRIEVARVA